MSRVRRPPKDERGDQRHDDEVGIVNCDKIERREKGADFLAYVLEC